MIWDRDSPFLFVFDRQKIASVYFSVPIEDDFMAYNIQLDLLEAHDPRVEVVVDFVFQLYVQSKPGREGPPKRFAVDNKV